ncbi:MAG: acyl-CoA dehydrogenase C-terminal domain-containing protein, partial [Pseudomonadota bacterium]
DDYTSQHEGNEDLAPFIEGLKSAKAQLQEATQWLMQNGMSNFNNAGASSNDYLHLFGLTALAYMWAQMAEVAMEKSGSGDPYYDTKVKTGRYFMDRILPDTAAHLAKVKSGADTMMALDAEDF